MPEGAELSGSFIARFYPTDPEAATADGGKRR